MGFNCVGPQSVIFEKLKFHKSWTFGKSEEELISNQTLLKRDLFDLLFPPELSVGLKTRGIHFIVSSHFSNGLLKLFPFLFLMIPFS